MPYVTNPLPWIQQALENSANEFEISLNCRSLDFRLLNLMPAILVARKLLKNKYLKFWETKQLMATYCPEVL